MIIALLGLALVAGGASPAPPPTSLPNVLVLFADDLGLNEILIPHAPYGYTGINGTIKTPALAQLADEGMLFMHWYSAFHVCSPSRAALQTGRLPLRLGIDTGVLTSEAKGGLQTNETTLAEMMKERGYATAMAGKWHLGQREEYLPHSRGYDRYFGIPYSCDMGESAWGAKHRQDPFQSVPLPLLNNTAGHRTVVAEQPADLRTLSSRYAAFGASFIKEQAAAKQPWFLFMSWNHVHTPQFANPQFCQSSPRGPLGDSVQEMDAAVGTVMAAVKAAGADDNTIVFFTSDNVSRPSFSVCVCARVRAIYHAATWLVACLLWLLACLLAQPPVSVLFASLTTSDSALPSAFPLLLASTGVCLPAPGSLGSITGRSDQRGRLRQPSPTGLQDHDLGGWHSHAGHRALAREDQGQERHLRACGDL